MPHPGAAPVTRAEEPARREVALRLEPQEAVTLSRAAPPMGLPARSLDSGHRGRTWWSLDTRGTTCPGTPRGTSFPPSCLEATGPLFPAVRLLSALLSPAILDAPSKVLHQPSFSGGVSFPAQITPGPLSRWSRRVSPFLLLGGVAGAGTLFLRSPPMSCTLPSPRTSPS